MKKILYYNYYSINFNRVNTSVKKGFGEFISDDFEAVRDRFIIHPLINLLTYYFINLMDTFTTLRN